MKRPKNKKQDNYRFSSFKVSSPKETRKTSLAVITHNIFMLICKTLEFVQVPLDQTVVFPGMLGKETTVLCMVDQTLPL